MSNRSCPLTSKCVLWHTCPHTLICQTHTTLINETLKKRNRKELILVEAERQNKENSKKAGQSVMPALLFMVQLMLLYNLRARQGPEN